MSDNNNRYFDIGDAQAKSKVGHSLRDQVAAIRKAINGGGVPPDSALLSAAEAESSAVVAHVVTTTLEDGSPVDTDERRILLGKRTITALEAADGAHAALPEEALVSASYHNLNTTGTEAATPPPPPPPGTSATVAPTASSSSTTTATTTTTTPAAQQSAAKKLRRMHEEKVHLTALRTRLTQVIADLQHERRENARLTDENANLRKEAEKSRTEFFDLKTQVHNLSAVVRELWSRQGGTLEDLRFLSSDAVQVVAQTVGLPPNGQQPVRDHDDEGATPSIEQCTDEVSGSEVIHSDRPAAALDVR